MINAAEFVYSLFLDPAFIVDDSVLKSRYKMLSASSSYLSTTAAANVDC